MPPPEDGGLRSHLYFEELTVVEENVDEAAGWKRIESFPGRWERVLGEPEA